MSPNTINCTKYYINRNYALLAPHPWAQQETVLVPEIPATGWIVEVDVRDLALH